MESVIGERPLPDMLDVSTGRSAGNGYLQVNGSSASGSRLSPDECPRDSNGSRAADHSRRGGHWAQWCSAERPRGNTRPRPCENSPMQLTNIKSTHQIALYSTIDTTGRVKGPPKTRRF